MWHRPLPFCLFHLHQVVLLYQPSLLQWSKGLHFKLKKKDRITFKLHNIILFYVKKGILSLKWSQMINLSFRNSPNHVERTYIANKAQYIVIPAWKVKMLFKWHKNHKVKLFLEWKDVIFWINYWTSLITFLITSASHYIRKKLLKINLTSSSTTLCWQEKRTIF